MKTYDVLDLMSPDVIVGQHSVWIPGLQVKVPFQWGGRIQKYRHPHETAYPLDLLREEVGLLCWLSARKYSPPIGRWVYFKTVISEHPGGWWADPMGAYGYEMVDATALPEGKLHGDSVGSTIQLAVGASVSASPGAWNDLNKPGNVVNGYLIDVRRSGWDRLHWYGERPLLPLYVEDSAALHVDLRKEGQFPYGERELPYQEYYLGGEWHRGERDVISRAKILNFVPAPTTSVLDIGTCLGGFLQFASLLGARTLVGLDVEPSYVDLARRLARANRMNICYYLMNAEDRREGLLSWMRTLAPGGLDVLLLLSMLKHFRGGEPSLWEIVEAVNAQTTFLETNAVKEGHPHPLLQEVLARHGTVLGWSRDRNSRICYRVDSRS
jgi:SAM-dependent methyltransferase